MLGTLVMDGRTYQITRIELRDGLFQVIAIGYGPACAVADEPLTVFGQDGKGVCQGWLASMPDVWPGETITITAPIRIVHVDNEVTSDYL